MKRAGAVDELVEIEGEKAKEFRLLGGEFADIVVDGERVVRVVEDTTAEMEDVTFGSSPVERAADGSIDASEEFVHRERFGDIVVGADLETFKDIALERFGRDEDDRDTFVGAAYFLSDGIAILDGHHNIQDAGVDVLVMIHFNSLFAIGGEADGEAFLRKIGTEDSAQVGVVLSNKKSDTKIHSGQKIRD